MQGVSLSGQCCSFLFSGVTARCFLIGEEKDAEFIPSLCVEGVVKVAPARS